MLAHRWCWVLSFMLLAGCSSLTGKVDQEASELAALVDREDIHPALDQVSTAAAEIKTTPTSSTSLPPPETTLAAPTTYPPLVHMPLPTAEVTPRIWSAQSVPAEKNLVVPMCLFCSVPGVCTPPLPTPQRIRTQTEQGAPLQAVASFQPDRKPPQRLVVPPALPGADAPPIAKFPEDPAQRKRYLEAMFPPLPAAPELRPTAPGPEGRPMMLADLQRLAAIYSPAIKSAQAAVEAADGAVKQAGAYPNPSFFFEQDTVGTGPGGYEGLGFNQVVKTANKLKLQQAAAVMELLNTKLALKRAYTDLAYQVRTNYFAVLVALESVRINEALYQFTDEIYRVQVELVEGTIAAPYEPLQLRPLAIQARFNLIQAHNQYLASWKQLAATLGLRDMPPTELAGRVDMPVPVFEYNDVLARVLAGHTDVRTAFNSIQKARFNLELAKVTPVPDVTLNVLVQKDYTAPPNLFVHSLQFSLPVPVWDQNVGNIKQAQGQLSQALAGPDQARNSLIMTLADAFNRYKTARENVDIAMQQCRDQVRAYRNLYARRQSDPTAVAFGDVVTAQQTLAGYIAGYVSALGLQWTAVNDVANLLQTDDLFQAGQRKETDPIPDLRQLIPPQELCPRQPGSGTRAQAMGSSPCLVNGRAAAWIVAQSSIRASDELSALGRMS